MNQQAEIHIFINYSDLDKIRTDLKFNSAKVAGYLRYYKCKANSEGISKMTSNERQKKIIRLLDKRRKDTMEHLSIEFHVSTDTISRDIATLNEDYAQKEKILSTERIANQNHKDVVLELQADGRDKPSLRLVKTKRAGISTMPNEFSRWGAYIFLTKDKLPNQISWKDENGESDE